MSNTSSVAGIVLAAGKGKRMLSTLPKVLHEVGGKSMLSHVVTAFDQAGIEDVCVVLSQNLAPFQRFLQEHSQLRVAIQSETNGTGGAVGSSACCFEGRTPPIFAPSRKVDALPLLRNEYALICAGDLPALKGNVLANFVNHCLAKEASLAVLGMELMEPKGYGRLVQGSNGELLNIVEEKDATDAQKQIRACNSGIIFAKVSVLFASLAKLQNNNAQNEYYLTDCIKIARDDGNKVEVFLTQEWQSLLGVNDPHQLAMVRDVIS